jgi:PAS domain S-box-containing protein
VLQISIDPVSRFGADVESNYIGSWAWDVRTGTLFWCTEHFRICGLKPGSVQPSHEMFLALVHPEDRANVSRSFDRALRERTEYKCRYRIVRSDSIRNIEAVARLVLDENLEPVRFVGTILDVTEQMRAAALLNENERRFALMLDSIPHQVWTYRIDGTIGYSNQKLLDYVGLSAEELQRTGRKDLHPDDIEVVRRAWHEAFDSGAPYEMEQRIRGRDGTYRRFLCRAIPIHDQHGQVLEYFGTATDVEELRRSDEALRAAQTDLARMSRIAVLGEISASLAHELNQPLAAIVANCDASLRWQRAVPANLEQVALAGERIRRDALRASAVLERIRAFIRKAAPEHAPVQLAEAVHEVLEMLASELQRHQIEIQVLIPPDLPPVAGTRVELQQVFLNLFTNAIESLAHEEEGKRRRLSVECTRGRMNHAEVLTVIVQDSGPGFPDDDHERLFDAFFTTKSEGLGMGLAVSRSIVRSHGGELRARNTTEGPRFEFYIKLTRPSTLV